MDRSPEIGALISALAKAQSEFGHAIKGNTNSAFNSKYADLADNIDAVRPSLNKHGIVFLQFPEVDVAAQTVTVTTALHLGEQFIANAFTAPGTGQRGFNVQSIGAATTYLRRYGLQAICGLASADDDGNSLAVDNKPVALPEMSKDELDDALDLISGAQSMEELKTFFEAGKLAALNAKDNIAVKIITQAKDQRKNQLKEKAESADLTDKLQKSIAIQGGKVAI